MGSKVQHVCKRLNSSNEQGNAQEVERCNENVFHIELMRSTFTFLLNSVPFFLDFLLIDRWVQHFAQFRNHWTFQSCKLPVENTTSDSNSNKNGKVAIEKAIELTVTSERNWNVDRFGKRKVYTTNTVSKSKWINWMWKWRRER